jgi:hypothetical protein
MFNGICGFKQPQTAGFQVLTKRRDVFIVQEEPDKLQSGEVEG